MSETTVKPWHFTVVFDADKAHRNGYRIRDLYDYVGKNVEQYGIERVANNTWQPKEGYDEVVAQCSALSKLSKAKWVMQNIDSITFFEGDSEPIDFIAETRKIHPELICD